MSYQVLAVDPGETVGWATGTLDKEAHSLHSIDYGVLPWKEFGLWMWRRQTGPNPFDVVVYETWRLRRSEAMKLVGSDLQSVQCVGQIKSAVWWGPEHTILVSQEPAKKDVINKQMARLKPDWLPPSIAGPNGNYMIHHQDAIRHLWHYAINKQGVRP